MNTLVFDPEKYGEMPIDVHQILADKRMIFICDTLNDKLATDVVATLMLKDMEDSTQPIKLYINSEGGDIRNAFMIYDAMKLTVSPIHTICIGSAMDEAAIILAAGTPGCRFATKHSVIAISQLETNSALFSDLTNAKANLDLVISDNKKMMNILSQTTKKPLKKIMADLERRIFMNASDAAKYNLIDKVISK